MFYIPIVCAFSKDDYFNINDLKTMTQANIYLYHFSYATNYIFSYFMVYMVLRFNLSYHNKHDELIKDRYLIFEKYLKGDFCFDFIVSFPFSMFFETESFYWKVSLVLKLFRIYNIIEIKNLLNRISSQHIKSKLFKFLMRIIGIVLIIVCVAHMGACLFFYLGNYEVNNYNIYFLFFSFIQKMNLEMMEYMVG